jgi:hypothetical protein
LSEESIHMSSQQVSGSPDRTRGSCRSAGEASKSKPRFAEFACSHTEVNRYPPSSFLTDTLKASNLGIPFHCSGHKGSRPKAFLGR